MNEIAQLNSGPSQGPVPGSARKQMMDKARFMSQSPKYERARRRGGQGAAVSGGLALAAAGINGLVGGERDRREQEGQY